MLRLKLRAIFIFIPTFSMFSSPAAAPAGPAPSLCRCAACAERACAERRLMAAFVAAVAPGAAADGDDDDEEENGSKDERILVRRAIKSIRTSGKKVKMSKYDLDRHCAGLL